MKTYESDIRESVGGIEGAGRRYNCEILQVWGGLGFGLARNHI